MNIVGAQELHHELPKWNISWWDFMCVVTPAWVLIILGMPQIKGIVECKN
jgi:hypothetical protein